jgi:hypothetical protein
MKGKAETRLLVHSSTKNKVEKQILLKKIGENFFIRQKTV